jgi:hypothetical protein
LWLHWRRSGTIVKINTAFSFSSIAGPHHRSRLPPATIAAKSAAATATAAAACRCRRLSSSFVIDVYVDFSAIGGPKSQII